MKNILTISIILISVLSYSQNNTRISNHNSIGWYNYFGNLKINKKFGVHTEYQWRRAETITDWQQSLLRVGINYQLQPKLQLRLGYAWIETFPYGEIPLNAMGKDFTEHRIFQMATITDKILILDLQHRFVLEQRFVGRYSKPELTSEDEYLFMNRLRYMLRLQFPLKGKQIQDKTPYAAIYDEIFVGFGENVNENVFDQNRVGVLLGYQFTKNFKIEGGYLNQIVQLGREVGGRNVFQYNNGLVVNAALNFDVSKK